MSLVRYEPAFDKKASREIDKTARAQLLKVQLDLQIRQLKLLGQAALTDLQLDKHAEIGQKIVDLICLKQAPVALRWLNLVELNSSARLPVAITPFASSNATGAVIERSESVGFEPRLSSVLSTMRVPAMSSAKVWPAR